MKRGISGLGPPERRRLEQLKEQNSKLKKPVAAVSDAELTESLERMARQNVAF